MALARAWPMVSRDGRIEVRELTTEKFTLATATDDWGELMAKANRHRIHRLCMNFLPNRSTPPPPTASAASPAACRVQLDQAPVDDDCGLQRRLESGNPRVQLFFRRVNLAFALQQQPPAVHAGWRVLAPICCKSGNDRVEPGKSAAAERSADRNRSR